MALSFWTAVRLSNEHKNPWHVLAQVARKNAGGRSIVRLSSGASVNVEPGITEYRACYVIRIKTHGGNS